MRYAVQNVVTFNSLFEARCGSVDILSLVLERMKLQLNTAGVALKDTTIRPYPASVGESSKNGYDKLIPRSGLQITLTGDT